MEELELQPQSSAPEAEAEVPEVGVLTPAAETLESDVAATEPDARAPEPGATAPEAEAVTPARETLESDVAATEPDAGAPEPGATAPEAAAVPEAEAVTPAGETPESDVAGTEPDAGAPEPAAAAPEAEAVTPEPEVEQDSGRVLGQTVSIEEWMASSEPGVEEAPQAESLEDVQLLAVLEACVYVAEEPLMPAQIAAALNQDPERVRTLLEQLVAEFERPEHGVSIKEVAGGYKMATKAEHHDAVRNFVKSLKAPLKLSLPALETLAVVAYKQPVTSPEIMEIRGVQGGGVLKTLLERKLITEAGRKNVIGKPILYKTTKEFLIQFGLKDLGELPSLKEFEEIRRMAMADSEIPAETPAVEESELHPQAVPSSRTADGTAASEAPAVETTAAAEADASAPESEATLSNEELIGEPTATESALAPEAEPSRPDAGEVAAGAGVEPQAAISESPGLDRDAASESASTADSGASAAHTDAGTGESPAIEPEVTPEFETALSKLAAVETEASWAAKASPQESDAVIVEPAASQREPTLPEVESAIAESTAPESEAAASPENQAAGAESPAAEAETLTEPEATTSESETLPPHPTSHSESQDH